MAKRSRHYRVAKKEVETKPIPANGVFIKKKEKNKFIIIATIIALAIFIDGIIMGYLISNNRD